MISSDRPTFCLFFFLISERAVQDRGGAGSVQTIFTGLEEGDTSIIELASERVAVVCCKQLGALLFSPSLSFACDTSHLCKAEGNGVALRW